MFIISLIEIFPSPIDDAYLCKSESFVVTELIDNSFHFADVSIDIAVVNPLTT